MGQQNAKSGRRLRWALGVSLALNLLVVAALVGAAMRGGGGPGKPDRGGVHSRNAAPYLQALLPQDRAQLRQSLRTDRKADRRQRRAQYRAVVTLLQAETLDTEALRAALAVQTDAMTNRFVTVQAAWLDRVQAMDGAERAAYAARLEEILRRGPRGAKRK